MWGTRTNKIRETAQPSMLFNRGEKLTPFLAGGGERRERTPILMRCEAEPIKMLWVPRRGEKEPEGLRPLT